jgi:hypothetical protein
MHARYHSSSGTFALELKFDSHSVFEPAVTRQLRGRLGVGVTYSALYAHHMLVKAERTLRNIID